MMKVKTEQRDCFTLFAMTEAGACHCEERSDVAISLLASHFRHCEECNDAAISPFLSQQRDRRASLAMTNEMQPSLRGAQRRGNLSSGLPLPSLRGAQRRGNLSVAFPLSVIARSATTWQSLCSPANDGIASLCSQ